MTDTVTPIPFRGDIIDYLNAGGARIEWLWRDRQAFIPVRPVCDRLGLAYQPQHRKLTAPETEATVTMKVTVGADGKQREMLHLAYEDFLMWLGNITPSRVKPEARDALRRTRIEIREVLATHYRERLFGEVAAVQMTISTFEAEWTSMRSWHP
ncbi:phage antirepressor N-terminal domain-containing protein, partial [uncultured Mameliella sp.]